MSLIGDYNPMDGLGDRLGWFSPDEAQELIDKVRAQNQGRCVIIRCTVPTGRAVPGKQCRCRGPANRSVLRLRQI